MVKREDWITPDVLEMDDEERLAHSLRQCEEGFVRLKRSRAELGEQIRCSPQRVAWLEERVAELERQRDAAIEALAQEATLRRALAHLAPRGRFLALRVIEHFNVLTPGDDAHPVPTDDGGVVLGWESDTSGREVVVAIPPDGAWAYVGGTDCGETYALRTLDDAALDKAALWLWGLSNAWPDGGDSEEGQT